MRRRSREARRSAFMLIGGALLSLAILGAWFPANALYHQHSSVAAANAQLNEIHQQDAALAQERKDLSDSAEIERIAREEYQLVSPGQGAYEVLPPTRASKPGTAYTGDPGLRGPVAPSTASVLPPGSATGSTQAGSVRHSSTSRGASTSQPVAQPRGFVARVEATLEFWR
jgi:cell division protein FtsB